MGSVRPLTGNRAERPTLLEAAVMMTVSPVLRSPSCTSAPQAVRYCIQIEAASGHESAAGCLTSACSGDTDQFRVDSVLLLREAGNCAQPCVPKK